MEWHIRFDDDAHALILLDQRLLPTREEFYSCTDVPETIYALQTMVIRGAPAIGVTAAYGCCLALRQALAQAGKGADWKKTLKGLLADLAEARPTAVNLAWAVRRMRRAWTPKMEADELQAKWLDMAKAIHADDIRINRELGFAGAAAIVDGDTVMTHCNAGALATAGYGTALGVVRAAVEQGKKISVIANETRPFLQGARLTAWELQKDDIPVTVACDNACALLMSRGMVDKVVVGADRIAANGDAANKIGTSGVAYLARQFGVPFYVAAPLSTIDRDTPTGESIPIEDRTPDEVVFVGDTRIVPEGVPVYNYAFDVTPGALIAGIATEMGMLTAPFTDSIAAAFDKAGDKA